jgi:signal transduction histidine kinase
VEERTEALRQLSSRLLQMQDEERRRIARELHDSAGQIVAALQMNLAQIQAIHRGSDGATLPRCISESGELMEQLSRELRTISHLLHPPLLDEAGLPSAVKWYVDGFSSRSGIQVGLELAPELGRLSHAVETTIFRIMQEALTNIHRHSGSKTALVRILRKEQAVRLEISDRGNGIGRNESGTETVQPGVGIQGMRERVRQLGGHFEIQSSAEGSTVLAILPAERTWMEKTRVAVDAAAAGGAAPQAWKELAVDSDETGSGGVKFLSQPHPRGLRRIPSCRDVAQPGRALAWGARGRQFKSARPDQFSLREPYLKWAADSN